MDVEIKQRISYEIQAAEPGSILFFLIDFERCSDMYVSILAGLLEGGGTGVFITTARPYCWWSKVLGENLIDESKVIFVDCVGGVEEAGEHTNVRCLKVPISLEELSKTVEDLIAGLSENNRFVVLDSLSILGLYISQREMEKLIDWMKECVIKVRAKGIIVAVDGLNPKLSHRVQKGVQRVVDLR